MPIYEYECTSCHHQFDMMQKISEAPVKQCPQCFEPTAIRLVSAAGFQLKGSGWYATDFKNKGKPGVASDAKTTDKTATDSTTSTSSAKGDKD